MADIHCPHCDRDFEIPELEEVELRMNDNKRADDTQKALWSIKEIAWELHKVAFWKPGVAQLVKSIETEVNILTRALGYDPTWIKK